MSDALPKIFLTENDWQRLNGLLSTVLRRLTEAEREVLDAELSRAVIVPSKEIKPNVVTMNSRVRFSLDDGRTLDRTLVYPWDADAETGKISVLAPIGSALLGLTVGDVMPLPLPGGKTLKLTLLEVLEQPEANGAE